MQRVGEFYGQIPVFVILPVTARIILRANPSFPRFVRKPHARQAKHQINQNPAAIDMQKKQDFLNHA